MGPGTQIAQGPGTQGHTKPLTLTLILMPGTINLTLLGPGPWDPGAHQTPNPNPNPKTHAWHDKPHALGFWAGPRPREGTGTQMAQGPGTQGHTKPLTLTLTLKLMPGTINLTLLGPGLGPGPGRALGPKWHRALGPRGTPNP